MKWQPSMVPMRAGRAAAFAASRSAGLSARVMPCAPSRESMKVRRCRVNW
jgi:hypothetical protein